MLQKVIEKLENYPLTFLHFLLGFSAMIVFRMLGENILGNLTGKSLDFFIGSTLAAYLFFLFSYLVILIYLAWWIKEPVRKPANILLWGFWLAVFPPFLDKILCGAERCWSFYAFDSLAGLGKRFLTFFGDNPMVGITYGVRIEVALAVIFLTLYIFLKTKKPLKAFLGGLISYAILFVLGSFPSWLTFFVLAPSKSIFQIGEIDIAGIFLSPVRYFSVSSGDIMNALNVKMNLVYAFLLTGAAIFFFWKNYREKFWPVAKNIRWIQIMIHAGIVLFGVGLGAFYFPKNVTLNVFSFLALANLILAAVFSWIASVFLNDQTDSEIDKISNTSRPLVSGKAVPSEYTQLFWASFWLSLLLALSVGVKFFLLAFSYHAISWIYSGWPFRLKSLPIVATFLSALALVLLFFSGFILLSDNQDISVLPSAVIWLLILAFTVSLPVKDLKDVEGDRKSGIYTIPVLLGETWARFAIGLGIFVSYALSVVWLNLKILFFPAMILGAASFWILQNKKISPRRVHIWVFGLLFVYVVLMAVTLFWPMFLV